MKFILGRAVYRANNSAVMTHSDARFARKFVSENDARSRIETRRIRRRIQLPVALAVDVAALQSRSEIASTEEIGDRFVRGRDQQAEPGRQAVRPVKLPTDADVPFLPVEVAVGF
ncbi:hypothetical protein [Bradyrhizobium sp. USDA 4506]